MAEGEAADTIVAENLLQVSTLGGDTKTLHVKYGEMWEGFKKLVEMEFDIPRGLQKFIQGDHVLQFDDFDCIVQLVEQSRLPEDKVITVTHIGGAWFWVDATGKNPSRVYSDHASSYEGLRNIVDWLDDAHGEDTDIEDIGAVGVIHLPGGEVPQTSAGLLNFLSGSEGEHEPVVPENDDSEAFACPWKDIADMAAVTISDIWPPRRAIAECYGVIRYPSAGEVTRALLCAEAEATEDELKDLASKSYFFACVPTADGMLGALKENEEMAPGSFFYEKDHPDPHVFVCANPTMQTVAFCYQTTFWY
eukprot:gnl/TRDRNA2_/TRDRNA2_193161_c0_seq1.p1 gnl/TRDRNA2_/TRDRNA2_193161_c0~~gnl/TRDRNA2_/TRDRNA2_193161_c0_seq1.p1  ORF type:complete len:306 (-),score=55.26 gnl/TRDRNA2_/TRDRNA2_193161_c0_seq1:228-1145(-)